MRTVIAVALNLLILPFGYYFLKQPVRFFAFLAAALLLGPALAVGHFFAFRLGGPWSAMLLLAGAAVLWHLLLVFDTLRAARRPPADAAFLKRPAAYGIVPACLGLVVGLSFLTAPLRERFTSAHNLAGSGGMIPTLQPGDYVSATSIFGDEAPARGDLVLFELPGHHGLYLLRVYGMPGERISSVTVAEGGGPVPFFKTRMYVDGRPVEQNCEPPPELVSRDAPAKDPPPPASPAEVLKAMPPRICVEQVGEKRVRVRETLIPTPGEKKFADVTLGPDEYFMLGDNRDAAYDSRTFGPVPAARIRKLYRYTFLSLRYDDQSGADDDACDRAPFRAGCFLAHANRYGLRLDRMGTVAE